jgi:hypothetical protein
VGEVGAGNFKASRSDQGGIMRGGANGAGAAFDGGGSGRLQARDEQMRERELKLLRS